MAMLPPRQSLPRKTIAFVPRAPARENRAVFSKVDETLARADERPAVISGNRTVRLPAPPVSTGVDSEVTLVAAPRWRQGSELRTPIPPSVIVSASLSMPAMPATLAPLVLDATDATDATDEIPSVRPVEAATTVSKRIVPRASTAARVGMVSAFACTVLAIAAFTFAIVMHPTRAHAATASEPVAMISMPAATTNATPIPMATPVAMTAAQSNLTLAAPPPVTAVVQEKSEKPHARERVEARAGMHTAAPMKPRAPLATSQARASNNTHASSVVAVASIKKPVSNDARDIMASAL
jgi:hypothetical protein